MAGTIGKVLYRRDNGCENWLRLIPRPTMDGRGAVTILDGWGHIYHGADDLPAGTVVLRARQHSRWAARLRAQGFRVAMEATGREGETR